MKFYHPVVFFGGMIGAMWALKELLDKLDHKGRSNDNRK